MYKTPKLEMRIIREMQNSYLVGCHVDSVRNNSNEMGKKRRVLETRSLSEDRATSENT